MTQPLTLTGPTPTSASGSQLVCLSTEETKIRWMTIKRFIDSVPDHDEWTNYQVKRWLEKAKAQCWMSKKDGLPEAVLITRIFIQRRATHDQPSSKNHKVCLLWILAGKDIDHWIDFLPVIEDWAKSSGCKYVQISGRKGWIRRLPLYREQYTVMKKRLR